MTQPLYYDLYADDDHFVMRAPMQTLRAVLDLTRNEEDRVARECKESGGVSTVHINGKARRVSLGGRFIMVQESVGPRSNY